MYGSSDLVSTPAQMVPAARSTAWRTAGPRRIRMCGRGLGKGESGLRKAAVKAIGLRAASEGRASGSLQGEAVEESPTPLADYEIYHPPSTFYFPFSPPFSL
ncbi:MAG: hypothetical protein MdMp014T_1823 [Treponematales bacterium]